MKTYRWRRLVLAQNSGLPGGWFSIPRLLRTANNIRVPWVWRLFWGHWCLGLLKKNWDKPVRLTRQLRRQFARKGKLHIVPGALAGLVAMVLMAMGTPAGAACLPIDAMMARAVLTYNLKMGNHLERQKIDDLMVRAAGFSYCGPDRVAEGNARIQADIAFESMLARAITEGIVDAELMLERFRIRRHR